MNEVTTEEKDGLTKTFAIVGFLVLIIFTVWLAVRIVSVLPSAFSSLASLADSVYNYRDAKVLVVTTENSVMNAGESFPITWAKMRRDGTYTFSYACTEGVAVDVRDAEGAISSLACGTPLILDGATSLEVLVASEKYRFVDIPYTITYTSKGDTEVGLATTKTITIVNATIPATGVAVVETPKPVIKPAVSKPAPTVTPTVTKKPTYVAPKTTTTVSKVVYSLPVSNPNGSIDLQVTILGTGILSGNTFSKASSIDVDKTGAIQFAVKNLGTKTTDVWSYVAHLPGDMTYTSGTQKALKPQEQAIITLGFEGITKTGSEKFDVAVTAQNDIKKTNNTAASSVVIVK
jgi:hypothetical protein